MVFPNIVVAISFWIHFLGVVLWVGASLLLPLVIMPAINSLEPAARLKPMAAIGQKLGPWFGLSIVLVFLSGILQAIHYNEFSSRILQIKIIVAILMVANGVYVGMLTRKVASLAPAPGTPPPAPFLKAQRMLVMHGWVQAGLAMIILLIVGLLRVGI